MTLQGGVRKVLQTTTINDAERVFEAIRLAKPGGLGKSETHDVTDTAKLTLRDVMCHASSRDLIARQYANYFGELFHVVQPYLLQAMQRHSRCENAISDLYLYLLGRYADSHIRRKQGETVAASISKLAAAVHKKFLDCRDEDTAQALLLEMDSKLKQQGINPGTTADFCVAGVLIYRLQTRAIFTTGVTREYSRIIRPTQAEMPHLI